MSDEPQEIVAYFDFDGTISDRDTFIPFLIYVVGKWTFFSHLPSLLPIVIKYWLGIFTNEQAKEQTLGLILSGYKEYVLEQKAKHFALTRLNKYVKPSIYARLEWHREHKHTIVIVSANLGIYLRHWAYLHRIPHVLATEIEFDQSQHATGKLQTRNCYGPEKVRRIKDFLATHRLKFCYSYAYGNSAGDDEMMHYADESFLVSGPFCENRA